MKAAVLNEFNSFNLRKMNRPTPRGSEVLVKVKAVGICDSDIRQVESGGRHKTAKIIGHEFAGVVEEIGSEVSSLQVGTRVTAVPFIPCGECSDCQRGDQHWCEEGKQLGTHLSGCFAEYVLVPEENVLPIGETIAFEEAVMLEPIAEIVHGMEKLAIKASDTVAVFGLNTFGLLNVQWLRQAGVKRIIGLDTDRNNLWEAKLHGVTDTIDLLRDSIEEQISQLTEGRGVDVAIECIGLSIAEEQCLLITKKGGTIGFYGQAPSNVMLRQQAFTNIFLREYTIMGLSSAYSAPFPGNEWAAALSLIEQKRLEPGTLISHRFTLDDIMLAFDLAMNKDIASWQVLLVPKT
ncbi:galactitol-1-phosphate 5-dehydrogenase [Candidatus Enterococcus ferrettii]|uniref:L-iditol 2-dehydrogenase n=1 Tax=Candidatus Enterococcus ferrettii TaxID=2815324 RepID=A0ABV0EKW3_9ENTE|nr:galactitol-1-phosphate 5-dehydrogenase [Enterococcus sp. 665A]